MEILVAPLLALLLVGLALRAAHGGAGVMEEAFAGWFSGHRPDPWPRGVQEEDAPRFRLDAAAPTCGSDGGATIDPRAAAEPLSRQDPAWSEGAQLIEPAESPCRDIEPAGRARVRSRHI